MTIQMKLEAILIRKPHSYLCLVKQRRQQRQQYRRKRKAETVSVSVLSNVCKSFNRLFVMSTNLEFRERDRQR